MRFLIALLATLLAAPAGAATLYVETTGNNGNPGSQALPVLTVQRAVDLAVAGDTIIVGTGTFTGDTIIAKNGLQLIGSGRSKTILKGQPAWGPNYEERAATIAVATNTTGILIRGFTIAGEYHGIFNSPGSLATIEYNLLEGAYLNNITVKGSSPTIRYNIMRGRSVHSPAYFFAYTAVDIWTPAQPVIQNNTMADFNAMGICTLQSALPIIRNNIIVNAPTGIGTPDGSANAQTIEYNNVWKNSTNFDAVTGWWTGRKGNISSDPVFISSATGDYRLRACSPSVDAGDPSATYNDGDGTRNDMGALYTPGGANALLAPREITARNLGNGYVEVTWAVSASSAVTEYHLYSASSGHLDYVTRTAVLAHPTTYWITPAPLADGANYVFGLRASDGICEEANTGVTASLKIWHTAPTQAQACIKTPKSGKRINGNRTLVKAEICRGLESSVSQVRFQYKKANTSDAWADIPAANINHPNPDTLKPWFVHWDVTAIEAATYEIRAAATSGGAEDSEPQSIWVTVDHDNPEVVSNDDDGDGDDKNGKRTHSESVYNTVDNVITVVESERDAEATLLLPVGSLSNSSTTVTVQVTQGAGVALAGAWTQSDDSTGVFLDITLSNNQTNLVVPATLVMSYPDADQDGFVDGTTASEDSLQLKYYDVPSATWKIVEGAQSVDTVANKVTAQTPHFTVFGLFFGVPAAVSLADVRVFPSPFIPDDGNADTGAAFVAGNMATGIVFDKVTNDVDIRVYDVTGREVWTFKSTNSGGTVQWDVRNNDGADVASGVYFAVIKGTGGTIKRKLAVIR
jgi:hypothetical protein